MKYLLIFLFIILPICSPVYSEESELRYNIHLASYHFNRDYDWNEENYGLGVEYGGETYTGVGYFRNSYAEDSFYILQGIEYAGIQLFVGVSSGYPEYLQDFSNLRVIAGVSKTFKNVKLTLNSTFIGVSITF